MRAPVVVRIEQQRVYRESDGQPMLILAGYLADRQVPVAVHVVEQPDDEPET